MIDVIRDSMVMEVPRAKAVLKMVLTPLYVQDVLLVK